MNFDKEWKCEEVRGWERMLANTFQIKIQRAIKHFSSSRPF